MKDTLYCDYFLDWVDKQELHYWDELRLEHVQAYQKVLEQKNYAFDTVRLYLLPVRRTSAWMAANWPREYVDFCKSIRLKKFSCQSGRYDEESGNPYLPVNRILDFLDWLSRDPVRDRLTVGVALQGLAGLQLQEAFRLTWDKVDVENGTIVIEGEVKNRFRIRKIPVAGIVHWLLRQRRRDNRHSDYVIPDYAEFTSYSQSIVRQMRRWNPKVEICPKDLRNTIQTAAIEEGWYSYYVQRYVGHSPQTIGERHYCGDQGKLLLPLFREKVVGHIESSIREWDGPEDSVLLPGLRMVKGGARRKIARSLHDASMRVDA